MYFVPLAYSGLQKVRPSSHRPDESAILPLNLFSAPLDFFFFAFASSSDDINLVLRVAIQKTHLERPNYTHYRFSSDRNPAYPIIP